MKHEDVASLVCIQQQGPCSTNYFFSDHRAALIVEGLHETRVELSTGSRGCVCSPRMLSIYIFVNF